MARVTRSRICRSALSNCPYRTTGRATKMPIRATSFSVSEAARRWSPRRQRDAGGGGGLGLSPAVSEGLVVIDLGEAGVDGSELVSNSLDARADIRSVAIFAAPRDESDVMHAVVDCPIGYVAADVRGQQMHDLELGEGEMNIGFVPEGTAAPGLQHQPAAMEVVDELGLAGLLHRIGDQPQAMGKDGNATGLVDEVERTAVEGELLVGRLRAAGQEDHRQGDTVAPQARQQIDARYAGQAPVQQDDFGFGPFCK